jgi:nucleotide-binding universal stress UspA family protein
MNVLIGFDGSDSAREAISQLDRAGLPPDTQGYVVSVADAWPPLPHSAYEPAKETMGWEASPIVMKGRALAAECLAEAQTLAAEGATLVKTRFPGWTVSHSACAGSPYLALIQASDAASDLVVVGSQGRSALGRLVMGSVSQNILNYASCSVRISRTGNRAAASGTEAPVRIILGVDGSIPSAAAVSAVASRAWPPGTEVKIITVLDRKLRMALIMPGKDGWAFPWTWVGEGNDDGQSRSRRAVEAVAAELRSVDLVSTLLVEEGDPKKVLLEEAERWDADCIFVGAKGHSGMERFVLGSVSAAVAARAHCSVEVVRQG